MISVHEAEKLSLQEIEQFLLAAKEVRFEASQREEIYGRVERLLCKQEYARQGYRLCRHTIARISSPSLRKNAPLSLPSPHTPGAFVVVVKGAAAPPDDLGVQNVIAL